MRRLLFALLLVASCGDGERPPPPEDVPRPEPQAAPDTAIPDHVVYDQVLIAFKGSYAKSDTSRPKEAARELALRVFELARSGGDFGALKQEYTDARSKEGEPFGAIHAARDGIPKADYEIYRGTLYPGPAFTIFRLKVGEVGLVEHDPQRCPDGWLIIKRLR